MVDLTQPAIVIIVECAVRTIEFTVVVVCTVLYSGTESLVVMVSAVRTFDYIGIQPCEELTLVDFPCDLYKLAH